MWYKEKYRIVTENPYNKEKLNGLGLVIYSEWKDSFVNIIQKNGIKHLFLNYSLGWKCSDYTFLRYIKPIKTLEIIDTHSVGIKNVEQQHELVTLCLNLPNANDIDYHAFYHLKNVFCYGDKRNDSLFSCNSIEKLYIDDFKIGDKHCIGNLKNLKDLTIANSNITSLSFAKELLQLKSLTILNCKKVQSFSDISFLRNLIRIEIRGVKNLHDINFLANSKNIEVVIIETDKLASIKSLASLKRIKALALFGKNFLIEDMDLTPIYNLEQLSMLDIPNRKCYPVKINCYWNWDEYGKIRKNWLTEK